MNDLEFSSKIREVLTRHYMPAEKLPDGRPNPDCNPVMQTEAKSAISCMISLAKVFKLLESKEHTFILPVIVDLSFGLEENLFWKQYKAMLIPVFKNALHGKLLSMVSQGHGRAVFDQQDKSWHNLFLLGYDCLHGIMRTTEVSPVLMHDLSSVL